MNPKNLRTPRTMSEARFDVPIRISEPRRDLATVVLNRVMYAGVVILVALVMMGVL